MIELEDMNEEDRAMCEEWEEFYKKPLPVLEYPDTLTRSNTRNNLAELMKQVSIPRIEETFTKAMEDGANARLRAGITYDINEYRFSMDKWEETAPQVDARMFVGIPYRLGKIGFDGCDCMGLASMFYCAHGWLLEKDGEGWQGTKNLFRYVRNTFKRIKKKELEYGDLILHGNHVDIFLGWSPSNDNDYVLLNQAINSGEGCTSSKIITIGDLEYNTSFDSKAEYYHRKSRYLTWLPNANDVEVITINLLGNPYEYRDPFFYMLYRGYELETADKIARDCEKALTMIDGRINDTIEKALARNTGKLYKELKRIQDEFNKRAIQEGSPTVELV